MRLHVRRLPVLAGLVAILALSLSSLQASANPAASADPAAGAAERAVAQASPYGVRAGEHTLTQVQAFSPDRAWFIGAHGSGVHAPTFWRWDGESWTRGRVMHTRDGELLGADGLSFDDAWIVGTYRAVHGSRYGALAQHWNGDRWTRTPTPKPALKQLNGVSELSPDDVWAVGSRDNRKHDIRTLAEHWDGHQWHVTPTPNIRNPVWNVLTDVVAFSDDDVWALGNTDLAWFTEHWDGTRWSIVSLPNPRDQLVSMAASGPDDIWAVGWNAEGTATDHWDGTAWTVVPDPSTGGEPVLHSVTVLSPTDAWVVGERYLIQGVPTLTEHWDGTQWSVVPSPKPGTGRNTLQAVDGDQPNDVWAVGLYTNGDDDYHMKQFAIHWNGDAWTRSPLGP